MAKKNKTTIKYFLLLALLFIIPISISNASSAEQEVQKFVEKVADQIILVVKNRSTSDSNKADKLMNIIQVNFDTNWMGRFALGREYRQLSSEQKKQYSKLYKQYLRNTYFPY